MSGTSCEAQSEEYVAFLRRLSHQWGGWSAAQLLTVELIDYIVPRFTFCSSPIKIRILTSLLYIEQSLREKCKVPLSKLVWESETDSNDWVRKLSRLLQPYVATGIIDIKETDTETAYKVIQFLDTQKALHNLNLRQKSALEASHMCDVMNAADFAPEIRLGTDAPDLYMRTAETVNFRPAVSFENFMKDTERRGLERMWKVETAYEQRQSQYQKRRPQTPLIRGDVKHQQTQHIPQHIPQQQQTQQQQTQQQQTQQHIPQQEVTPVPQQHHDTHSAETTQQLQSTQQFPQLPQAKPQFSQPTHSTQQQCSQPTD